MDVRASVLAKIKPAKQEEERVKAFVSQLQAVSKTVSGLDAVIVGSIGKFTWLAGDHDVDVFLMFDQTVAREELERLGLEYGKRIAQELGGKTDIKYAEHPYVHAVIKGFDVDIVPCYRIRHGEKIKSAVDRSPLHLQYVLDYMRPSLADEVRLLKQFCKGIGVYGSDAKHQGFSGYICELLVLQYGSFDKVIDAASAWRPPFTINVERHLGLNMNKFHGPLVIIDPVDADRNVAAVVSGDSFVRFVSSCKRYQKQQSVDFFFAKPKKPLTPKQTSDLVKRGTGFFAIEFKRPDVIDDTLYPQLRRALARFVSMLEYNEFRVVRAMEFAKKDPVMIFELEVCQLPSIKKMTGPPIFEEKHSAEFLGKYAKNFVYIQDNRWVADMPRKYITAEQMFVDFLKNKPEALVESGIPKYIAAAITKKKAVHGKAFWKLVKRNVPLSCHLAERYFVDYSNDFIS